MVKQYADVSMCVIMPCLLLCHLKASVVLLSYIFVVLMTKHMHW
jgi:hypothetical protein